ncbi:MAG: autoinducer binding domain-containing protein [Pseudomonadales bacterium]
MNIPQIMTDYIVELDRSETVEACFDALSGGAQKLGFQGIVYTSIAMGLKPLEDHGPLFFRSEGFDANFLAHYEAENFAEHDYTIKRILEDNLASSHWQKEIAAGCLLADEQRVIDVAKYDYGINNGLSIPLLKNAYHMAGSSVVSEEEDLQFDKLLEERLEPLQAMIRLFHNKTYADIGLRKALYLPLLQSLSEVEKLVLRYSVSGLPLKMIEQATGMSASYAGNVRAALFRKLGVSNVAQLSYIAGLHRILEML